MSECLRVMTESRTTGGVALCACASCTQMRDYFRNREPRQFRPRFWFDFNNAHPYAGLHLGQSIVLYEAEDPDAVIEADAVITEIRFDGEVVHIRCEWRPEDDG